MDFYYTTVEIKTNQKRKAKAVYSKLAIGISLLLYREVGRPYSRIKERLQVYPVDLGMCKGRGRLEA